MSLNKCWCFPEECKKKNVNCFPTFPTFMLLKKHCQIYTFTNLSNIFNLIEEYRLVLNNIVTFRLDASDMALTETLPPLLT